MIEHRNNESKANRVKSINNKIKVEILKFDDAKQQIEMILPVHKIQEALEDSQMGRMY